jgi:hypothetical protein
MCTQLLLEEKSQKYDENDEKKKPGKKGRKKTIGRLS